jgi:hypothetical protein
MVWSRAEADGALAALESSREHLQTLEGSKAVVAARVTQQAKQIRDLEEELQQCQQVCPCPFPHKR